MSKSNIKIAVICVNYNSESFTKKMCESLLNGSNSILVDIIIVDNSDLNSSMLMEYSSRHKNIKYLKQNVNNGYFSGLNFGLNYIKTVDYEYVVVGNNDLEYDQSFLSKLTELKVSNNIQVICPDVLTIDGVHQNPHHLHALSKFEKLAFDVYFSNYYLSLVLTKLKKIVRKQAEAIPVKPDKDESKQLLEINQGVGACYVLTQNFFKHHNELFFPFFLYGEEAVLSWQVRNSNGILCYAPSLKVLHAESATLSQLPSKTTYGFGRDSYWKLRKYL